MYENQSFPAIMARMLAVVPSDVDKREGSIVYTALAPAAVELANMYIELDINLRQASAQTATGMYLDLRTADYGVTRRPAAKAVHKGLFVNGNGSPFDVPLGSRYSAGKLNFVVTEKITAGQFQLQCELAGSVGNAVTGALLPIDYISGLAAVTITELLIPGTDIQTDEELRKEYLTTVREPSTSGNKADYRNWALQVAGVGDAAVKPLWDGPGTVKLYVIDADQQPASIQLVEEVQNYISPEAGMGEGKAPIGAAVTVVAATGIDIDVTAEVVLNGTRTLSQVAADFGADLTAYLKSLTFGIDPSVKYVRIGALLLDTAGVQDYSNLLVNGGTSNISIHLGEVAVKGTVMLDE
ncbi:baseplate J/gp47 family protein [Paenibacillus periandrae]|uniref:baseplate J/gp47 family protein n=1 Tax=Paenibacillus periandrae TaxID=1761741 RepID=UPI001F095A70|nr:baseplate J/gp47 family protein [Paenibacillus periandrae]